MQNFRQFEAGPDPFGRKFQVFFKWLQTAISIRHSDTVEKTIALPHTALLAVSRDAGRKMDDPWCSRLAELHLLHLVETGEDMEKDLVTVTLPDLKRYAAKLAA
jgi:hypothetical protein